MSKEAKEYFKKEWGTGFISATLHDKNGFLELSMDDIYDTMQLYASQHTANVLENLLYKYNYQTKN